MKTTNKILFKIFIAAMLMANLAGALFFAPKAEAKSKRYTKTVKVLVKKEDQTVNLSKKLKKGDKIKTEKIVIDNDEDVYFYVTKKSAKKVEFHVKSKEFCDNFAETGAVVKIKTKKKGTIKIKVNVDTDLTPAKDPGLDYQIPFASAKEKEYFNKIVQELKSQFADPDKSYKEIYKKKFKAGVPDDIKKQNLFQRYFTDANVTIYLTQPSVNISDWILDPEKNIYYRETKPDDRYVELHYNQWVNPNKGVLPHMWYAYEESGYLKPRFGEVENPWKAIYEGTYEGVCGESSKRVCMLAEALGFNARYRKNMEMNHGWAVIESYDAKGVKYWKGIAGSSTSFNMEWNATTVTETKDGNVKSGVYNPSSDW